MKKAHILVWFGWAVLFLASVFGIVYGFYPVMMPNVRMSLGNYTIILFCAVMGAFALFHKKILDFLGAHKAARIIAAAILSLAAILLILAVIISAFMAKAIYDNPEKPSVIIVLGCRVNGTSPSPMLMQRINAACRVLEEHPETIAIASGGQGADEAVSEAECIKRVLVQRGIDESRIILEDKSTSTRENMAFSKRILEELESGGYELSEVAVVSNEYHLMRARKIAKKQGMEVKCIPARTVRFYLPANWIREIFGNAYEIVFNN